MKIKQVRAIEVLDSRGNPTLKAYVTSSSGKTGEAFVPSGASTGTHEACELRDGDMNRYHGKGVKKAVGNVNNKINKLLQDKNLENLEEIDKLMIEADNTENKTKLGANAILSVSLAAARCLAFENKQTLWKTINKYYFNKAKPGFPRLMVNVINGGKHAGWNFDIQEFMICPKNNKPGKSAAAASEIFHSLGNILKDKKLSTLVGDEGGYSPALSSNEEVFEYLIRATKKSGYKKTDIDFAVDVAASEFYKKNGYFLKKKNKTLSTKELLQYYLSIKKKYNLISYEDPFAEDDWQGFELITEKLGRNTLIVGDDLLVTNPKRIKQAIDQKAANAVLIKVNQIGTLFETVEAINLARKAGWDVVISHRSGETEDAFIADLAYACHADFIKTGSMSRSDRLAKYNRLLEIEAREI